MSSPAKSEITRGGRIVVLIIAFLGWMFAGTTMAIIPLIGRAAVRSMGVVDESMVGRWFSWYICAFLLGAACGGLLFGWLGDRWGRSTALAWSILCFTGLTGVTYFAMSPGQLLVLRFLACLGVGGIWPNAVALVSEAWEDVSRPLLSGLIGTAANLGFMLLSAASIYRPITTEHWRWVLAFGAAPIVLGLIALVLLPESPSWRQNVEQMSVAKTPAWKVFQPPYLKLTLLGICLGAIPLMGNWGSANWMVPMGRKNRWSRRSRSESVDAVVQVRRWSRRGFARRLAGQSVWTSQDILRN